MNPRRTALSNLCSEYQIDILYSFGSRAEEIRGWLDGEVESLPAGPSDADIGVKPVAGAAFSVHKKVRLAVSLEDLLGVNRVDLVSLRDADPFLAANIVRGERLFARDETQADEYDLYILRRAGDLAPFERERMAMILEKKE